MQRINTKGGVLEWKGAELVGDLQREMARRAERVGALVSSQVKQNISESSRGSGPSKAGEYPHANTGRLRNSIFYTVKREGGKYIITIGTPLLYGLWLEIGTQGGKVIVPTSAKVLHWMRDGRHFFARRVIQGPIAPRRYLARTVAETRTRWLAILLAPYRPGGTSGGAA